MDRKSRTSIAGRVVTITRKHIRITVPRNGVLRNVVLLVLASFIGSTYLCSKVLERSQQQQKAANTYRNARPAPATIGAATRSNNGTNEAADKRIETRGQVNRFLDWGVKWLEPQSFGALLLLGIGFAGTWLAVGTLLSLQHEVIATAQAARAASDNAIAAKDTAIAAKDSATAAKDTVTTNQEIERAYMRMDYRDLLWLERKLIEPVRPTANHAHPDTCDLIVEIRNVGRTPGTIVGGWCGFLYRPANEIPPKLFPAIGSSARLLRLFLFPDQLIDFAMQITLKKSEILFLRRGEPKDGHGVVEGTDLPVEDKWFLWLAGEIDYVDRFKQFHRAGFAKRWDRSIENMVFDQSVGDLNYDRPMTEFEIEQRAYKS
jgi:hypothetical protein